MNTLLSVISLLITHAPTAVDTTQQHVGVQMYTGFIIPHAPDLRALSQTRPVGLEITYSRTALSQTAYERCNCFARVGAYVQYVSFGNAAELGRTFGAGAYFEPLIRYRKPLYFSLRATAGLTYLTRVYSVETNPRNTFFGAPLSGLLALSVHAHHRFTNRLHLSATARYNHISNGGIRQPNRGMNFPTVGVGVTYHISSTPFPDAGQWPRPVLSQRFTRRVMAYGSVRTLPQTPRFPERAGWLWGLTATAGFRVSRFHTFTGGLEFADDGYVRQQLRRTNLTVSHRQLSLLGGYELWLGRYIFATYVGWNALQPITTLSGGRVFQRYQLVYTLRSRYLMGIGLKAKLNVAEGLDVRIGLRF